MLQLVTAPTHPFTASELRAHVRVDIDTDDAVLGAFATAGLNHCQDFTRRAITAQTWDLFLDEWPADTVPIQVPLPPLSTVTSVKYIDGDGILQTWSNTKYTVDTAGNRVIPNYGEYYPTVRAVPNAITIRFDAGYADADVPAPIKAAMLLTMADLYENREAQSAVQLYRNETVQRLLWPYRWF